MKGKQPFTRGIILPVKGVVKGKFNFNRKYFSIREWRRK
nr:MAG TPA: hypothetical protein [Caudoviricetes sp.]